MEHPANSYKDTDFIVPMENATPADIKLAVLYMDDIKDGRKLSPPYRNRGLVRPYNAGMSRKYRKNGCDLPDIELVVQWKMPQNLSAWVQRAGCAAHGPGLQGMAVMLRHQLLLKPLYADAGGEEVEAEDKVEAVVAEVKKQGKDYAVLHGVNQGSFKRTDDAVPPPTEYIITDDMPHEGIYMLIQSSKCQCLFLCQVFQNPSHYVPADRCCDICNLKLFDRVRPSKAM
ncbi:hypothetical protein K438DRAFT_1904617 [Mycena galopus ATCC 62051]|nr:hypothetical protein K438DRAFT_1904617 [Mycena galopus ATCC 62051]